MREREKKKKKDNIMELMEGWHMSAHVICLTTEQNKVFYHVIVKYHVLNFFLHFLFLIIMSFYCAKWVS